MGKIETRHKKVMEFVVTVIRCREEGLIGTTGIATFLGVTAKRPKVRVIEDNQPLGQLSSLLSTSPPPSLSLKMGTHLLHFLGLYHHRVSPSETIRCSRLLYPLIGCARATLIVPWCKYEGLKINAGVLMRH